jgi:Zn-dependent M28 family amino/carboxypeptidase
MKKLVSFSFAVAIAAPLAAGQEGAAPFSAGEYSAHLKFLANDLCEGRAVGTRGGELAAAYIAAQFEAAGLEPISAEEGYYQRVPLKGAKTRQESVRFSLSAGERSVAFTPVEEVVANSELDWDTVEVEGELLFVGYGVEAPELDWDDYKGVEAAGKILVMLVNDPDFELTGFGGESLTYYGRWTYKEEIARAKGARGLILIHTDETAGYGFEVIRSSWTGERIDYQDADAQPLEINAWLSREAADRALALVETSYDELKASADRREFRPRPLALRLEAGLGQDRRKTTSPNVLGLLRGSSKADEVVIITGHYDHLGIGLPDADGDTIYNGAMDNASGTSALICLARAFARSSQPPQRSVLFFANTGEESGLLGSTWYAKHPLFPLDKTTVVLNKDVCETLGAKTAFKAFPAEYSNAVETLERIGAELDLAYEEAGVDRTGLAFRSDHFPFAARGIVAMSVGLAGDYRDLTEERVKEIKAEIGGTYHQASDEVHPLWNTDGALQELELLYRIGRHFADGAPAPTMNADHPYVSTRRLFVK